MPSETYKEKVAGTAANVMMHYQERVAAGVCVLCAAKPPVPGKRKCQACGDYTSAKMRATRNKLHEQGLCTDCREPMPAGDEHRLCPSCRAFKRAYNSAKHAEIVARRTCIDCGSAKPFSRYLRCEECLQKYRAKRGNRDTSTAARCHECGRMLPADEKHYNCALCRKIKRERAKQLYHRRKSEHRCVSCNEPLPSYETRYRCRLCRMMYSGTDVEKKP